MVFINKNFSNSNKKNNLIIKNKKKWLAPNTMTVFGFMLQLMTILMMIYYDPTLNNNIPS